MMHVSDKDTMEDRAGLCMMHSIWNRILPLIEAVSSYQNIQVDRLMPNFASSS
jgi:hypothetical protein